MRLRHSTVDALIVVAVASTPVVIEHVRGLVHAAGDLAHMFIPHYAWWWQRPRWLGGWNPWIFGGFPSNADPLVGHVHPLGLVWAVLPPLTASAVEGALAPALAGLGMLAYLRSIGCDRMGALVGALAFSAGGYVHAHATHPEKLRTVLAIPWALAAIETLDGRRLVVGLGAAVFVLIAGGHPQTIALSLTVVAAYGMLFGSRRTWVLGGLAVGTALSAVTWLPAIQLVLRTEHLGGLVPVDRLSATCMHTLVVPFGCGGGSSPFYGTSVARFPGCGLVSCTGYPGMLVWLLLLAATARILATGRGLFWLVVAVAGVVLATGVVDGVLVVPGLRAPSRALLWWSLGTAAVAGLGYRASDPPAGRAWLVAAALLACVLGWTAAGDAVARRAAFGSLLVLSITLLAVWPTVRWLAVAALVGDLMLFGAEFHAGVPSAFAAGVRRDLRAAEAVRRAGDDPTAGYGRVLYVPTLLQSMEAQLERVPIVQGWNVLVPGALTRLLGAPAQVADLGVVSDPAILAPTSHVLDLLRVRIIGFHDRLLRDPRWEQSLDHARWTIVAKQPGGLRLAANERARPVAWLVHDSRTVTADEAVKLVRGELAPFDPASVALTTEPVTLAPPRAPEDVQVLRYDDDAITLRASVSAAALLVTSEFAYPGWRVWVDGREAHVREVNAGFRAVEVPAGQHEVEFRYHPVLSRVGLAVGLIAGLLLVWCARR